MPEFRPDPVGWAGIILTVVLLVLDKAGKLKGGWLIFLLIVAGTMTLFLAIGNSWVGDAPQKWRMWRGALMVVVVVLLYSGLAIWISDPYREDASRPKSMSPVAAASQRPPTLIDLFWSDFPDAVKGKLEPEGLFVTFNFPEGAVPVKAQLLWDLQSRVKFIAFYIPASEHTYTICKTLGTPENIAHLWDKFKKVTINVRDPDQQKTINEFPSSGRVFLYHQSDMTIKERAELIDTYRLQHLDLEFRSSQYVQNMTIQSAKK